MDYAFDYVEKNPLNTEEQYPYKAKKAKCHKKEGGVGTVSNYKDVQSKSVE